MLSISADVSATDAEYSDDLRSRSFYLLDLDTEANHEYEKYREPDDNSSNR